MRHVQKLFADVCARGEPTRECQWVVWYQGRRVHSREAQRWWQAWLLRGSRTVPSQYVGLATSKPLVNRSKFAMHVAHQDTISCQTNLAGSSSISKYRRGANLSASGYRASSPDVGFKVAADYPSVTTRSVKNWRVCHVNDGRRCYHEWQ